MYKIRGDRTGAGEGSRVALSGGRGHRKGRCVHRVSSGHHRRKRARTGGAPLAASPPVQAPPRPTRKSVLVIDTAHVQYMHME